MSSIIKKIFLVDDDQDDQLLFQEALYEVDNSIDYISAYNGVEALEKLTLHAVIPDILFMDINMPKMNGMDCLKELQKFEGLKELPVIMYSTSFSADYQKECFNAGASGYMEKPNDFNELCSRLRNILSVGSLCLIKNIL